MMMYGQPVVQGQPQGGNGNEGQQQPGENQQGGAYQGYPPGLFPQMPFFNQSQAAAAHAAAAMAEQRLSSMPQGYPAGGMDYSDPRFAAQGFAAAGQFSPNAGDPNQAQDYMNANQLLLARLQQGGQAANWMQMGYGMAPQGMDGYAESGMLGPWSATSAGLLGKIGGPEQKKKNVRKKHKDKPKRPLSAYNLFFKDERKKILESIPAKNEDGEDIEEKPDEEGDEDDKGRKRKKAPHGKIGFENLAKIIGQRWQKLESDRIEHYKKLAAKDMKRYKEQMEVFLTKIENEKKKKFEEENGGAAAVDDGEAEGGDGEESSEPPAKKLKTEEDAEEDVKGDEGEEE